MNGFLPCCPYDCQTLMDSDILIDDFLRMEKDLSDGENEMNLSTELVDNGPKICDYDLSNSSRSHSTKPAIDDDRQKFALQGSILAPAVSPSTSLAEALSETQAIVTGSEDPSGLSSVSKVFSIAIFEDSDSFRDSADNVESFQDLNAFLNKVDTGASEDLLYAASIHTADDLPSSTGEDSTTVNQCPSASEFSSASPSVCEENELGEPPNKIARSEEASKTEKYFEMRRKNNISSRRSRQTKKQRERELEEREKHLIEENESLRKREKELELLVQKVKDILFSSVKNKS